MASSSNSSFSKGRIMHTLTTMQHTSALVFGSFLVVHLAAPAVAVVAPRGESVELATKTMILGRVYYQNVLTEPLIVYTSISVHIISSIAKKVIQLYRRRQRRKADEPGLTEGYVIKEEGAEEIVKPAKRSLPISVHTLTGLILVPAVTIHAYLNRIVPSSSYTPINELSPSELDYSYVTHGFLTPSKVTRYITWTLYASLLVAGAVHVVGGTDRIAKRVKAKKGMRETKKQGALPLGSSRSQMKTFDANRRKQKAAAINAAVSIAGVAWLAAGIRRMSMDDVNGASSWMTKRLDACYAAVWPYSMLK